MDNKQEGPKEPANDFLLKQLSSYLNDFKEE